MSATDSAGMSSLVSRNDARQAFAKALRLRVGYRRPDGKVEHRRFTMAEVVEATGVPKRTIECAMEESDSPEYRNPPLCAVLSLAKFFGPSFTSEWLGKAEQGAFSLPGEDGTPPGAIAADNAEDNATVARAAADGKFDDDEKPALHVVGQNMIERGKKLLAA
jgi:hypothetical protein